MAASQGASMSRINALRIAKWLLVGMATLPAALYAYLGHFSRMTLDDYVNISRGLELGPLQNMLYWRSAWTGHYSTPFLFGLLAPLNAAIPAIVPIIVVAIWTLALTWLLSQIAAIFDSGSNQLALGFSIAALSVAASIGAFYTPQSFYWIIASIEYTLPVAIFTAYLALMLTAAKRARSIAGLTVSALGGALICFVCAGFSEMYLVFQLAFMSLLLALLFVFTVRTLRWKVFALIGAGWLGTLASFAVQWSSPGREIRTERIWQFAQFQPIRDLARACESVCLIDLYQLASESRYDRELFAAIRGWDGCIARV